jgi:hypothetical protein
MVYPNTKRGAGMLVRRRRVNLCTCRLILRAMLAAMLIGILPKGAAAIVPIRDDHGGNIGAYWSRYMTLRDTGEQIVIDGTDGGMGYRKGTPSTHLSKRRFREQILTKILNHSRLDLGIDFISDRQRA